MATFLVVERKIWIRIVILLILLVSIIFCYQLYIKDSKSQDQPDAMLSQDGGEASEFIIDADRHSIFDTSSSYEQVEVTVEPVQKGFFLDYRIEREQIKAANVEQMKAIIEASANTENDYVYKRLLEMLNRSEIEIRLEGLIEAMGFGETLVVYSDGGVVVLVSELIDKNDAASIGDLVAKVAEVSLSEITISDGVNAARSLSSSFIQ